MRSDIYFRIITLPLSKDLTLETYLKKEAHLMKELKPKSGITYFINDCIAIYEVVHGDKGSGETIMLYGGATNLDDLIEKIKNVMPNARASANNIKHFP